MTRKSKKLFGLYKYSTLDPDLEIKTNRKPAQIAWKSSSVSAVSELSGLRTPTSLLPDDAGRRRSRLRRPGITLILAPKGHTTPIELLYLGESATMMIQGKKSHRLNIFLAGVF